MLSSKSFKLSALILRSALHSELGCPTSSFARRCPAAGVGKTPDGRGCLGGNELLTDTQVCCWTHGSIT